MKPEKQGKPGEGEDGDGAKTHGGRRMDQERVDIEADKTSPEAFRRDILEAMKRRGPSAYGEQVRRYYRELVK